SDRFNKVEAAFVKMNSTGIYDTKLTKDWSSHEWIHFISLLPEDASVQLLKNMDLAFKFTTSGNCEILDIWFEKAIKAGYAKDIMDKIEAFLVQIGRRKYIMPLYKAFKTTGQLETARKIYAQARPNYHSVSVNSVDLLLKE
nr:leukotriene A4 hydrolase C-terminal domain-containing protein [Saprospiraceae bacterium]